jgi:hypothetical protein
MRIDSGVKACEYICVVGALYMCVLHLLGQTPAHLIFCSIPNPNTGKQPKGGRKQGIVYPLFIIKR